MIGLPLQDGSRHLSIAHRRWGILLLPVLPLSGRLGLHIARESADGWLATTVWATWSNFLKTLLILFLVLPRQSLLVALIVHRLMEGFGLGLGTAHQADLVIFAILRHRLRVRDVRD